MINNSNNILFKKSQSPRIVGYDVARALAIFGMVIVNFKVVMGASNAGSAWLVWLVGLLDGRAAATFVILAGVGISLMSKKARQLNTKSAKVANQILLLKRAVFLFVVGLLYISIWPADILHFYGVYIALATMVLYVSDRWLWIWVSVAIIGFVILLIGFDYEIGWNWQTLEYNDFWTLRGMLRRIFFNGFHPVFPWVSFLLIGLWLGRQNIQNQVFRRKVLLVALMVMGITEGITWFLRSLLSSKLTGVNKEIMITLFDTAPLPPVPFYVLAAGATAVAIIILCVMLTEKFSKARWLNPLIFTGQLSLTLYVAHVVIGMGILETVGLLKNQSLSFALISATLFCIGAVLFATLWRMYFKRGPLEFVMRELTG